MNGSRVIVLITALAVVAGGPLSLAKAPFTEKADYANTTVTVPVAVSKAGFEQKLNSQIPLDLVFKNEAGEEVRLGDYFGKKPVLLNLVYFNCPMLCTVVLNGLTETMKDIPFTPGNEYEVLTISFNHLETPELAAAKKTSYLALLEKPEADKGWHFLTGNEENIKKLTDAVGFTFNWDAQREEYAHASGIIVSTPEGLLSHYFYGVMYQPRDVRLALVEASKGNIGSPVDKMMLFCYKYDSATGTYSAAIMKLLQVASAITLSLLGGFLYLSLRREFRARRLNPVVAG
jgi:protein SCO1